MKEVRYIVDTTLRDGEQSPGIALLPEDKVKIAGLLDELGVYEIEAGVPILSETEEEGICRIIENKKNAKISVWSRMNVEDVKRSIVCKPDIIHIGTPVSYIQIYSKLKKNKNWIIRNILECVEVAKNQGVDVTVGFEDASRADIGFLLSLSKELKRAGVEIIRIADTVGVLTPSRTMELIRTLVSNTDLTIEVHIHNDLGMAVANSLTGAKAGAKLIDCTLFGIGERTGNCNLYDFVHAADPIFDFGMTKKQIKSIEEQVYDMLKNIFI
ncbi:homocitrate synthase [Lachnospiraceae bacterium MD1]|uniref:Homocitrate synthase n=1 Tax=Variimorphobacter saccharofermentans TaxID=2755051 RepID=A0A839JZ77_9FIRM|nr:homocitrate synthase [Variimorphobacter saccharofermentans]MBB2182664.1 homocitrate synthase [Variimorphobacter saccharofermentans]